MSISEQKGGQNERNPDARERERERERVKIEGEGQEEEGRKERWLRRREGYLVWSQPRLVVGGMQGDETRWLDADWTAAEKRWTAAGIVSRQTRKGEKEEKKRKEKRVWTGGNLRLS